MRFGPRATIAQHYREIAEDEWRDRVPGGDHRCVPAGQPSGDETWGVRARSVGSESPVLHRQGTLMSMQFEWNSTKAAGNLKKHRAF